MLHQTGTYVLVPLPAAPDPVRQPQGVRAYAPNQANGYGQPPSNVIPFRKVEECQLVPPGVDRFGNPVNPWADFLARQPDLDPNQLAGRVGFDVMGLVPGEEDQRRLEQLHHPATVQDRNPNASASSDPGADARGGRGFAVARAAPMLVPGGAGPEPAA
jgi:hypothetical protein